MLAELACLALAAGRLDEAETFARSSLEIAERLQDRAGRVFGVGILAGVAAERGLGARAGRLWRAIERDDALAPLGGWRRHRDAFERQISAVAGRSSTAVTRQAAS
jgi:hypothetical protein